MLICYGREVWTAAIPNEHLDMGKITHLILKCTGDPTGKYSVVVKSNQNKQLNTQKTKQTRTHLQCSSGGGRRNIMSGLGLIILTVANWIWKLTWNARSNWRNARLATVIILELIKCIIFVSYIKIWWTRFYVFVEDILNLCFWKWIS